MEILYFRHKSSTKIIFSKKKPITIDHAMPTIPKYFNKTVLATTMKIVSIIEAKSKAFVFFNESKTVCGNNARLITNKT